MTCDILIRSYYKDFGWLAYCLRSVRLFCTGFRRTLVVVPESSARRLPQGLLSEEALLVCRDYRDDYLGQQATKLLADSLTDADFIFHIDSDCVFHRSTAPQDLIVDGRPDLAFTPHEQFPRPAPWKAATEKFLRLPVRHDFMRRQPLVYPRWLYAAVRRHATQVHGLDLERYVLAQPPGGFSEFNALGAYAYQHHRGAFRWIEMAKDAPNEPFCRWFWSWGGLSAVMREELEHLLRASGRTP
jgi:hypothetical protein